MATMTNEKDLHAVHQHNDIQHSNDLVDDKLGTEDFHGFVADSTTVPKGYFTSLYFMGSITAIGVNLLASTAGFALIAPILGSIDVAIGPSPYIYWVALVYTLGLAIGLTLIGRISDLFGRRYIFLFGTFLGVLGAIIASTSKTIPSLIGGQTLIGLSACTGYSYHIITGELVPVKRRFIFNAVIFVFSYPTAGFGAAVSTAFVLYTNAGWRWAYYLLIILNGAAFALYAIFYHPPTFHMKHRGDSILAWVKNFDYIGTLLYIAGQLLFIMGLSWGGSAYPWKSAKVISTIVIGALCLVALFLYETFANLKEPLIPIHLFKRKGWFPSVLLLSIGASVYYAFAILWPSMVANVYADGRAMWGGWISCLVGLGITTGEVFANIIAVKVGKTKLQAICAITSGSILIACAATCNPDTPKTAIALVFTSCFAIGYNEAIATGMTIINLTDHQEIGVAGGVAGSTRSTISSIAEAVYLVVLSNRLGKTIPAMVVPAVVGAGLPASSVKAYFAAVTAGTAKALQAVPGISPAIIAAGANAYKHAYSSAYSTVFLTTIAFSAIAIVTACFTPNMDHLMTDDLAATLHGTGTKEVVGSKHDDMTHA